MPEQQLKPTSETASLAPGGFTVEAEWASDRGKVRPLNEDSARVVIPPDPAVRERKGVLLVVADGMGGHEGGELASRMTVERVLTTYYSSPADIGTALVEAVRSANREVLDYARRNPRLAGMGTTCVAAVVAGAQAWVAYVGDSRLYLVRGGSAYRMTEDHSAAMQLVTHGLLTLEQAGHHEERNVILRAVGTRPQIEISSWQKPFALRAEDRLVLCSDGMYETIPDQEIAGICSARSAAGACHALLKLALEREGTDNITVAVLHVLAPMEAL